MTRRGFARSPGRLRRAYWIKEGDVVIVKPWVVQTETEDIAGRSVC